MCETNKLKAFLLVTCPEKTPTILLPGPRGSYLKSIERCEWGKEREARWVSTRRQRVCLYSLRRRRAALLQCGSGGGARSAVSRIADRVRRRRGGGGRAGPRGNRIRSMSNAAREQCSAAARQVAPVAACCLIACPATPIHTFKLLLFRFGQISKEKWVKYEMWGVSVTPYRGTPRVLDFSHRNRFWSKKMFSWKRLLFLVRFFSCNEKFNQR